MDTDPNQGTTSWKAVASVLAISAGLIGAFSAGYALGKERASVHVVPAQPIDHSWLYFSSISQNEIESRLNDARPRPEHVHFVSGAPPDCGFSLWYKRDASGYRYNVRYSLPLSCPPRQDEIEKYIKDEGIIFGGIGHDGTKLVAFYITWEKK